MLTRNQLLLAIIAMLVYAASPVCAWIYDGGIAQHMGFTVKSDSSCEWVAAPFTVDSDCYANTLGAAIARGFGPADAGFDIYLTTSLYGLPGSAIAKLSQPLVPLSTQYVYYDGLLDTPVFLKAGTVYSMVLMPTSPSLIASVSWGAKPGTYYGKGTSDYGNSWYQLSYPVCVRVDGYVIPEPSSMVVLLSAILGMGILRKRVL